MAKKTDNQIALAQNFLRSSKLVRQLLDTSSIESSDTVYEVGPGRGIITAELAQEIQRERAAKFCNNCSRSGHDQDARYCKHCGSVFADPDA